MGRLRLASRVVGAESCGVDATRAPGCLQAPTTDHHTTPSALEGSNHVVTAVALEGVDLQPQDAAAIVAAVFHPAACCVALADGRQAAERGHWLLWQVGPGRAGRRLPAEVWAAAISCSSGREVAPCCWGAAGAGSKQTGAGTGTTGSDRREMQERAGGGREESAAGLPCSELKNGEPIRLSRRLSVE